MTAVYVKTYFVVIVLLLFLNLHTLAQNDIVVLFLNLHTLAQNDILETTKGYSVSQTFLIWCYYSSSNLLLYNFI